MSLVWVKRRAIGKRYLLGSDLARAFVAFMGSQQPDRLR